jgi:ribonuclease-3
MDFLSKYGITIKNEDLLLTALTHSSYANENNVESYERLEFLGDAVLELATSEYFYLYYKGDEGKMTKTRASYVCEEALFEYSKELGIEKLIRVGNGVKDENKSIVADCFESVLAVVFLEHGYSVAKKYVLSIIKPYVESNHKFIEDYKTYLQEVLQAQQKTLEYILTSEEGPQNDKVFEVDCVVDGLTLGHGSGHSKKEAEQNAAKDAISKMA